MSNKYYIEQLKPIEELAWQEPNVNTLGWVQVGDLQFTTVSDARKHISQKGDWRLSYRITDGGRVWQI